MQADAVAFTVGDDSDKARLADRLFADNHVAAMGDGAVCCDGAVINADPIRMITLALHDSEPKGFKIETFIIPPQKYCSMYNL